jgi:hypothetical protein
MSVPEKRHSPLARAMERNTALQRAANLVGQVDLATGMGIADRTLRSYLGVERGMPASALTGAALVLRRRAADLLAHADRLDELAAS